MSEEEQKYKCIHKEDYDFLIDFFNKYKKIETITKFVCENYFADIENIDFEKRFIESVFEALNDSNSQYLSQEEYKDYIMYENLSQRELQESILKEKIMGFSVHQNIIYIKINSFRKGTAKTFFDEMEELKWYNKDAIIIDLRGNMGGIIEEAIEIAKNFFAQTVVALFEDNKKQKYTVHSHENLYDIPLYVLIDRNTGSASELLAAAIKENKRGKLIGEKTYGKGTVQKVVTLFDGSGVKLSVAEFFSPQGNKIENVGVIPNYVVKNLAYSMDHLIGCIKSGHWEL